ncbi:MAG: hypothetical protein AMS24_03355 [Chlamydiae bacterium SM23_39]|nr:MAG: hypothetical protein AMS24_03355 [Chlamydiae bacterium SM23_39]
MKKYYFLCCFFPVLNWQVKPELSFFELDRILRWHLSDKDKSLLKIFKQYVDIKNIKALLENLRLDPRSNLDEKGLDQSFLVGDFFPYLVFDFLKKYTGKEDRITNFASLLSNFLNYQIDNTKSPFLSFYFKMEREIRIVLSALRAKELKKDIVKELFFEDPRDPFINFIFSQKEDESLEVPKEYLQLKELFLKNKENPKHLEIALLKFKFFKNNDEMKKYFFNIDQILGYLANLIIIEDLYFLMQHPKKEVVDKLVI